MRSSFGVPLVCRERSLWGARAPFRPGSEPKLRQPRESGPMESPARPAQPGAAAGVRGAASAGCPRALPRLQPLEFHFNGAEGPTLLRPHAPRSPPLPRCGPTQPGRAGGTGSIPTALPRDTSLTDGGLCQVAAEVFRKTSSISACHSPHLSLGLGSLPLHALLPRPPRLHHSGTARALAARQEPEPGARERGGEEAGGGGEGTRDADWRAPAAGPEPASFVCLPSAEEREAAARPALANQGPAGAGRGLGHWCEPSY